MHENSWYNTFNNAKQGLGMQPDGAATIGLLVAGVLVVIGVSIAGHTYLKGRGQQVSLRGATSHLFGLVWLFPIAALVLMAVVYLGQGRQSHEAVPEQKPDLGEPVEVIHFDASDSADTTLVTSVGERPAWVDASDINIEGGGQLITVQGKQFAEEPQARRDALDEAVALIRQDFEHTQRAEGSKWNLSPNLVREVAVKDTWVEPILRSTGVNEFSVYRVYHQVELSPQVREAVYTSWRSQVVESRVWTLGGLLGFLTLLVGTAATYLRIDTLTGGNYRRRLKLASVSLVAAGGLGLAVLLPLT